nr:MAG TPA: GDPD protein [Caudoviricetes sp.]
MRDAAENAQPTGRVLRVRRRDGGDVTGRLYRRRRDGGDIPLRPRPTAPDAAARDLVAELLTARPFYISHRLGGTEYPEFTQDGLDASLRAGFKALEISLRRCASGEYVMIHDWTTERTVPGTKLPIWSTPWDTLKTLRQAAGPLMRFNDLLEQLPDDVVLAVDHKATSAKPDANSSDLQSELDLYTLLDDAFDGHPERRVLWKHFVNAGSVERAKARGYRTMCMMYPNELGTADTSRWDVLGLEWNAPDGAWQQLTATGKPTIAHIITSPSQAKTALGKGATGLMASWPTTVHP